MRLNAAVTNPGSAQSHISPIGHLYLPHGQDSVTPGLAKSLCLVPHLDAETCCRLLFLFSLLVTVDRSQCCIVHPSTLCNRTLQKIVLPPPNKDQFPPIFPKYLTS